MNHKEKVKLAKRMRSRAEEIGHTSIFSTKAWTARKDGIAGRVKRQQDTAHARALKRKQHE